MVTVALRGLTKRWGQSTAVDELDLDIADRDFVVLLGPSGCGKTTTMRMVAGLEPVTAGDVLIGGERVNDRPARERDIAMVFQNYGLYPHFTVRENIAYPLRLRRVPADERRRRVEAAAAKVHLDGLLDRRPRALSGGQRQRVALARAIVRTPRLFLMDEPLSNLDAVLRASMRAELKHLHHELNTTTIYVTHDQIEAMTLASRVAVMNAGKIVQFDRPEKIYEDPAHLFVARFVGSPPMNLIEGQLSGGRFTADGISLDGLPQSGEGQAVLGVRPDHLKLGPPDRGDLTGTVFAVEYTGSGLLVTVNIGEALVTAMSAVTPRPTIDERVWLTLDREQIFLFDPISQLRIRR